MVRGMSDVTAVVLSVGEDSTARAIGSLECQTVPVTETVVVRDISPFHRAFNTGVARVQTPFFVQVDADMVLDNTCVGDLRDAMADGVGVVVGHLRDPLLGRVRGIKLFRTECCALVPLRDSPSPETDFNEDILPYGWRNIYALKSTSSSPEDWHVFGDHRPDYTLAYTFSKFARDSVKARYRKVGPALRRKFQRLRQSTHSAAGVAVIAAAHGIFIDTGADIQVPGRHEDDSRFLQQFLDGLGQREDVPPPPDDLIQADLRAGFKRAYALGIHLRQPPAAARFMACLSQLQQTADVGSWVALVGLCQGLFVERYSEAEADEAFTVLKDLLPGS
jgi:hypothetical protein